MSTLNGEVSSSGSVVRHVDFLLLSFKGVKNLSYFVLVSCPFHRFRVPNFLGLFKRVYI